MKTLLKITILISIIFTTFLFPQLRGLKIVERDKFTGDAEELTLYENTYALVIGIDNYSNLGFNQQLHYAVKDAKAVAKSMRDNFQFNNVITLYNERATKTNVQKEISKFRKTGREDGIFIFFAGHGYTESTQDGDLGYIIPHDGNMNEIEMYMNISMDELKNYLKPIEAKHVFVVVDACYSGTMLVTRAGQDEPQTDLSYFKEISRGRVRQVLTAGGKNQQVLDGGPGGHSVFTGYFLQYLENASTYITASQLGYKVPKQVYSVARERGHTQVPQFGNLIGEGDFVFISSKTPPPPVLNQSKTTSESGEIDYDILASKIAAQLEGGNKEAEEEKALRGEKEESTSSQPNKEAVLFDVNRRESWYYYISYSMATKHGYPDGLKDWFEESVDDWDAIEARTEAAIELIGVYWHINPKIIGGFVYDYSNDYTIFNDNYPTLSNLKMAHTFLGLSVLGYFSEFGRGTFYRIDIGQANMDYDLSVNNDDDTELSKSGIGFSFGIGYSWYIEQLKKARLFTSLNYSVRNVDMTDSTVPILGDFEHYSKGSLNIGIIF